MAFIDVFVSYLKLGVNHILDINGFDHLLFIITICAVYKPEEWRKVAVLITAFTIGHSVTLALASFKVIMPNKYLIEILIPFTILASSIYNLFMEKEKTRTSLYFKYALALVFGFIHGMGFSNFFSFLIGDSGNIVLPLFSFNLGIEIGQLLIIGLYYIFYIVLFRAIQLSHRKFVIVFSGIGLIASLILIIDRI
jgi:hypothetical protein